MCSGTSRTSRSPRRGNKYDVVNDRSSVAAVVITLNAGATVSECLQSLGAQTSPPDEIILVDGGSSDNTLEIVGMFPKVMVIDSKPGFSRQRNNGARAASSDYVMFIDSDMVLSPELIEECVGLSKSGLDSLVIPEHFSGTGFWGKVRAFERTFYDNVPWIEAARWFRREAFEELGGFDENIAHGEEWDLDERARKLLRVGRCNSDIECVEGHLKLGAILRKKAHYSELTDGFEIFAKRHPERARLALSAAPRLKLFTGQVQRLLRNPILTGGVAFLGISELFVSRSPRFRKALAENPWATRTS